MDAFVFLTAPGGGPSTPGPRGAGVLSHLGLGRGQLELGDRDDLLPGLERTSLGYYSLEEIAGPGEASSLYARTEAGWRPAAGLEIELFDDVKLVEDDVRDDVSEWVTGDTSRLANVYTILNPPPADPLVMRESLVNTASLGLIYAPTPQMRFTSDVLHFYNRQSEIEEDGVLVIWGYASIMITALWFWFCWEFMWLLMTESWKYLKDYFQ